MEVESERVIFVIHFIFNVKSAFSKNELTKRYLENTNMQAKEQSKRKE
jgi:hypothetical protein